MTGPRATGGARSEHQWMLAPQTCNVPFYQLTGLSAKKVILAPLESFWLDEVWVHLQGMIDQNLKSLFVLGKTIRYED